MLDRYEIGSIDASRGGECQRRGLDWVTAQRTPDVYDAVTACEEFLGFGFVWDVQGDSFRCCARGLVDVGAGDGLTGSTVFLATDCVVEEDYFVGCWDGLAQEGFDFWVVDFADGGVGIEGAVGCFCGDVLEGLDGVFVEVVARLLAADVG